LAESLQISGQRSADLIEVRDMEMELAGQSCVVIGGASGIGLAIAQAFSKEGCLVGIVDRNGQALESLSDIDGVETFEGDIASDTSMRASHDHFQKAFGRIDHVVVAAATTSGKFGFPFWNMEPSDWAHVVDVNLIGPVRVGHAYGPTLAEQGSGTMLFLVSVAAQMGSQTDPPYSAAKAGLVNFMQCAAKDLAPFRVRVNALSPGMVRTPLNQQVWEASQDQLPEAARQDYEVWADEKIQKIAPLGQWQEPLEFGAMAVFLASPLAKNITGQTLNIDGGQVMHA
jgi:2-hydroxycyclohexanecarboxyl-CoA dehydrogenase